MKTIKELNEFYILTKRPLIFRRGFFIGVSKRWN